MNEFNIVIGMTTSNSSAYNDPLTQINKLIVSVPISSLYIPPKEFPLIIQQSFVNATQYSGRINRIVQLSFHSIKSIFPQHEAMYLNFSVSERNKQQIIIIHTFTAFKYHNWLRFHKY